MARRSDRRNFLGGLGMGGFATALIVQGRRTEASTTGVGQQDTGGEEFTGKTERGEGYPKFSDAFEEALKNAVDKVKSSTSPQFTIVNVEGQRGDPGINPNYWATVTIRVTKAEE